MKLKFYIPVIGLSVLSVASHACINNYVLELGYGGLDLQTAQNQLAQGDFPKSKSIEDLNDYGVLLIYAHQFDQAIQIFQRIEKSHPNLAKTAANLGTAYELAGQSEKAKYWIEQGMQRDPNLHQGSEWIHVKILDAKIQQQKDSTWIQRHDVLGLDFGQAAEPKAKVKTVQFQHKHYDLDQILLHSQTQMNQRLRFAKRDPITAQIIFNMANIEMLNYNLVDDTVDLLYRRAQDIGYLNPKLIESRLDYFQHSKWFRFKAFFVNIYQTFKNLII
ncbi:type IV pilus biogenesis/stability protein PilW [Acinetobacter guillouiae]|uniref:tetratricopeptide repeat protein n=1 Tax=Acinetobacter guillouiae TaxID=106649 RepID=UPI003AF7F6A4